MKDFVIDVFEHTKQKEQCIDFSSLDLSELFKDSKFSVEYLLR